MQFYKKNKLLLLVLLGAFLIIAIVWWNNIKQQEASRLNTERAHIVKVFREMGIQSAKMQAEMQKNKKMPNELEEEDVLAPHELSNQAEVTQAKLWLSLPKEKRAIMQTETIQSGLASAKKEDTAQ